VILSVVITAAFMGCGGGPDNVIRDDSQPVPVLESDLSTAENYFSKEDYANAVVAYDNFIKKHPLNDNIPYALFREGLSYFKVSEDTRRDQSNTERAAEKFSQLILMYPNSKYVSNAMSYLRLCHERLALYNFNVGVYYFDKEEYNAAILRFQDVITKYPGFGYDEESKRYIEESKKRLSEAK
jgi:outer membrane protein assembly factor BamD